ncbi:hypothetical protein PIB30_098138 [Stylosanthes scabra]|uniref:Uncharacterized protein n=1 Tax=Stylosanthes scabra TaxID=79078 RepID=A0ABU6QX67_9FABA|nr:hypothetical protein [Stylosanthes scabra]
MVGKKCSGSENSFLALVHHEGKIKRKPRESVKFTDKSPTNVFVITRTRSFELQQSILCKLCYDGRNCVSRIYYRISIAVIAQSVNSASTIYSCWEPHVPCLYRTTAPQLVKSPSFGVNLERKEDHGGGDLGDNRFFEELAIAMAGTPQVPSPHAEERVLDPHVEEALCNDDTDDEPTIIEGDNN